MISPNFMIYLPKGDGKMITSRIREIRKQKGLTLQDVAEKAGTTAQTIGRLETGMRTLSLKWLSRIAKALEEDPASLLSIPETGDIEIEGEIRSGGEVVGGSFGTLGLRFFAKAPISVRVNSDLGSFRKGDVLVFETLEKGICLGKEGLVTMKNGKRYLALILKGSIPGTHTLVLSGDGGTIMENVQVAGAAPLVALVKRF